MENEKQPLYKLNLSGGDITIKDKSITEKVAREVILLIMGGGLKASSDLLGNDNPNTKNGQPLTPKDFMSLKKPSSEVERVTCLGYYLSHYADTPHFKTKNITKLNRDAAQPDFSNTAVFVRNAERDGYFAKAGAGNKQMSVLGEAVVEALPDREEVKKAIEKNKVKRKKYSAKRKKKTSK